MRGFTLRGNSFLMSMFNNWIITIRADRYADDYEGEMYRYGIKRLIQNCQDLNIIPVFVTYSIAFSEDSDKETLDYWNVVMMNGHASAYAMAKVVAKHNEIMIDFAQKYGIILVDSRPVLNNKPEYFIDVCHFTQEGYRELTRLIAPVVLQIARDTFKDNNRGIVNRHYE